MYRCSACGNRTRFDVYETKRVRTFQHFTLGGESAVEEEEVIDARVERVVCRWCGSHDVERSAGDVGAGAPATGG